MTGQRKIVVKPDEAAVIEELCSIIETKAKVGLKFIWGQHNNLIFQPNLF